jgi:23S rRNA pseudouridine1911/1915/1917 synthase
VTLHIHKELLIPQDYTLQRLDKVAAELFPEYSRARLQLWIKSGGLTVNGKAAKAKDKVYGGENIVVSVDEEGSADLAEDIALDLVFEDEHLIVVNKPVGLVVHPGAGNPRGTLLNALLSHDASLAHVPRAGIVHRLDKDTSGLMVVAKTLESQNFLVREIQERRVTRIYDAIAYGVFKRAEGSIERAIGRNPFHRKKMAIRVGGKEARTHYRVLKQFEEHALVECKLDTGRTHQIRVHLESIRHPLVGDPTYGGTYRRPKLGDEWLASTLKDFGRQALHARRLGLNHPATGKSMNFVAPHPQDFGELLGLLIDA